MFLQKIYSHIKASPWEEKETGWKTKVNIVSGYVKATDFC